MTPFGVMDVVGDSTYTIGNVLLELGDRFGQPMQDYFAV